jgi:hypothetical protein
VQEVWMYSPRGNARPYTKPEQGRRDGGGCCARVDSDDMGDAAAVAAVVTVMALSLRALRRLSHSYESNQANVQTDGKVVDVVGWYDKQMRYVQ